MKTKNISYKKLSIIVILIGIMLRLFLASVHHPAGDACWQLSASRFIAVQNRFPLVEQFGRDEPFWPPPLFHILTAGLYKSFSIFGNGSAETAIKFISPLFGSLTLIIFYLVSKKLFNEKTVFYSVLFLAFIPLHLDYSVFSYIDSTVAFFALLSVYFALKNEIIFSSLSAALSILTKYNGAFILPILLYIFYKNNKNNKKKVVLYLFIILFVPLLISSVWFVRNWSYLGNPVWPFLNNAFNGYEAPSFKNWKVGSASIGNILDFKSAASVYLGIFGVPDGNINSLNFIKIPYFKILFGLWLISTLIFVLPFVAGVLSKKLRQRNLLFLWVLCYVALILVYAANASWSAARLMLPALPAIALVWANGLNIAHLKIKKMLILVLCIIIIGFVFTSFLKITLASKSWRFYSEDFEWVKSNTENHAIFFSESQCISYNINRQSINPDIKNIDKADYIFVNQNFKLDNRAVFAEGIMQVLHNRVIPVYENKKTGSTVYRVIKG